MWLEVERTRKKEFKSLATGASLGSTGQGRASGCAHPGRSEQRGGEREPKRTSLGGRVGMVNFMCQFGRYSVKYHPRCFREDSFLMGFTCESVDFV